MSTPLNAAPSPLQAPLPTALPPRVLVLGGTGFVGRALCERLQRAGVAQITVPTRRLRQAQALRPLANVQVVQADVHDPATLARLVAGADAVVNLVAILHGSAAAFDHVHRALPEKLARACAQASVKRLVHVSALGVGPDAPSRYLQSKTAGEAVLQRAVQSDGLALTLLRPSVIFGAQDRFLNLFAGLQALAPLMPLAGQNARFQPVWVDDVAAALVAALAQPAEATAARPVVEATGPEVFTLGQLVHLAGEWAGHDRPQLPLPHWAGWLQALALEWAPGGPLMSRDNLLSMQVPNVATGTLPGLDSLGVQPTSLRAVAPLYLGAGQGCARLENWRAWRR